MKGGIVVIGILAILLLSSITIGFAGNNINGNLVKKINVNKNVKGYTPDNVIRINSDADFAYSHGVISEIKISKDMFNFSIVRFSGSNGKSAKEISANKNVKEYTHHDVIRINSNDDFNATNGVVGGSGTQSDPYIISGWYIDAYHEKYGIYIGNTTSYFIIKNCYITNVSVDSISYPYTYDGGAITLYRVQNGTIKNNKIVDNDGVGIVADGYYNFYSSIKILNNTITSNSWDGIMLWADTSNTIISENKISNSPEGVFLWGATKTTVMSNEFYNNNVGILMWGWYWDSTNNKVYNNSFKRGIFLSGDKNVFTTQNISENNTVNGKPVYYYKNANMNNATAPTDAGEIILGNVTWFKIQHVDLSNRYMGIEAGYSSHVEIDNNTISNNSYAGVYLKSSNLCIIDNNSMFNNSLYGIYLSSSTNDIIINNNMINNGIYLKGDKKSFTTQIISTTNTVNGKPVYYYKNVNMDNATAPTDAGEIILGNVTWFKIENLQLSNNSVSIEVGYSSYIKISNTTIANNGYSAIYITYSSGNTLFNNTVFENDWAGIYLYQSSNNVIIYNNISKNWVGGIILDGSSNSNTINNNRISENWVGIQGWGWESSQNKISNNLIYNNKWYGIYIYDGSYKNYIYKNSFYYNHGSGDIYNSSHIQACDHGNNYWNTTSGYGNYWHDWANNNNTNDQNNDGIVDWPYKIVGGRKDYYPLKNATYLIPPLPPRNLQAKLGNGYVNLTWEKPLGEGSSPITGYKIYRNGVLLTTVQETQLYYNDTNVVNGQTYTYYVTAVNSVGESEKSNEVQATPGGAIPEFSTGIWIAFLIIISILGVVRFRKS